MKIVTIKFYLNPRYKGVLYLSCDKIPTGVINFKQYKYPTKSFIIKAFKRWAITKLDDCFKDHMINSNFIHIYDLEIEEDEFNKYFTCRS